MKRLQLVLSGLLLAGSLSACVVRGHAHGGLYTSSPGVVIIEEEPPPPPPRRTIVYRPGYIWIEGRYHWNGGRYVWRDGYYERERAGHVYRPGRWERRGRGHVWVDGRWEAGGRARGHDHHRDRARVRDHR